MYRRTTFRLLAVTIAWAAPVAAFAASAATPHWDYSGHDGPPHWGELAPEFATCRLGKTQSPIDIDAPTKAALPAIKVNYRPSVLKTFNNGHTLQVNIEPGSSIGVGERQFELAQFHFHTPSEEQVRGKRYDAVWHLVHKDAQNKLGVVAVLVTGGKANAEIGKILAHLPEEQNKERVAGIKINPLRLLPRDRGYYHFVGSLTTPPCSEDVGWYVLKQPIEASKEQIGKLRALFGDNARPVQPLNGRVVQESN